MRERLRAHRGGGLSGGSAGTGGQWPPLREQPLDQGYGAVCDEQGQLIDGFIMIDANQEHGILSWRDGRHDPGLAERFAVGARLRILPNHACATAAQFPGYDVLAADGGLRRWDRFYGW